VYEAAPLITDFNSSAPPDLQRIVRRCLSKDRQERYQTIKDVAFELNELSIDTNVPSSGSTATLGRQTTNQSARSISSDEYIISSNNKHIYGTIIAAYLGTILF